jgi:hypothetical protein
MCSFGGRYVEPRAEAYGFSKLNAATTRTPLGRGKTGAPSKHPPVMLFLAALSAVSIVTFVSSGSGRPAELLELLELLASMQLRICFTWRPTAS